MTLDVGEFIRRFLIHVLPKGFHRIRHYGLLRQRPKPRWSPRLASCSRVPATEPAGRRGRCDGARPAVPLLRRPHARHRDLRARHPPAPSPVGACRRHQDRHVMSTIALSDTIALLARWSATGCDDARAMKRRDTTFAAPIMPVAYRYRCLQPAQTRSPTAAIDSAQAPIPLPPPEPPRPNPHSARGTVAAHLSRVPSLEAFGRRPPARAAPSRWAGIRNPSQEQTSSLHRT